MLKLSPQDQHFLKGVLSPSWLSGLMAILAGIVVTGGALITFSLNNSAFKQYLIGWEESRNQTTITAASQSSVAVQPTLANSWSLIVVWALVGLLTYAVAVWIVSGIIKTIEFQRELSYVHANPRSMIEIAIGNIVLRVLSAVLLGFAIALFMQRLLPQAIRDDRTASAHLLRLHSLRLVAISFLLAAVSAYVGAILLRLTLGKARIFSSY